MKKLSYSECITAVGQLHFCALWCLGCCLTEEIAAGTWIREEHVWGWLMMTPVSIFVFGSIYWVLVISYTVRKPFAPRREPANRLAPLKRTDEATITNK